MRDREDGIGGMERMNMNVHQWESTYLSIEGCRLHLLVQDQGYDEWLILWPGMGGTAEQFISLLKKRSKLKLNVIAIDPPGHGLSEDWTADAFTIEATQQIWKGIMTFSAINAAYIGGHSYGAYSALWAIEAIGQRVKGIVLLDGGYLETFQDIDFHDLSQQNLAYIDSQKFDSWEEYIQAERQQAPYWNEDLERMACSTMKAVNGKIVLRISHKTADQVSRLLQEFSIKRLPMIDLPVLLLYASLPHEFKEERERGIANLKARVPQLKAIEVPNSQHDVMVDQPQFVCEQLLEFI